MSGSHLRLKALFFLALLGLSGFAKAWTDLQVQLAVEKRALLGGNACTLATQYGYVRYRSTQLDRYLSLF